MVPRLSSRGSKSKNYGKSLRPYRAFFLSRNWAGFDRSHPSRRSTVVVLGRSGMDIHASSVHGLLPTDFIGNYRAIIEGAGECFFSTMAG